MIAYLQYKLFVLVLVVLMQLSVAVISKTTSQPILRFYYENQSEILKSHLQQVSQENSNEIPLEFYQQLNNVTDISEFIELFVDKDDIDPKLGLQGNLKRNVERANIVKPEPVGCQPVNTIVPLTPTDSGPETNKFTYWPACTYVMRCSDCCDSKKVGCQPVESELVNFRVLKYVYGSRKLAGVEIIPIEKHLNCAVQCRTKAEDCKSFQVYRPDLCNCVCKSSEDSNIHEELAKCSADNNKIWDDQNCQCLCRETLPCTTGTVFDESYCKCVAVSTHHSLSPTQHFISILTAFGLNLSKNIKHIAVRKAVRMWWCCYLVLTVLGTYPSNVLFNYARKYARGKF